MGTKKVLRMVAFQPSLSSQHFSTVSLPNFNLKKSRFRARSSVGQVQLDVPLGSQASVSSFEISSRRLLFCSWQLTAESSKYEENMNSSGLAVLHNVACNMLQVQI